MKRTNIDIMKALDGLNLNAKYKNVLFDVLNSANDNNNDENTELINKYAYGIRWDDTKPGSTCERIGNLDLHRSLPIQSKLSICIHKGQYVYNYTELDDARFKNEYEKYTYSIDKVKLIDGYQCIPIEVENANHLYSWVKIRVDGYEYIGRVIPAEDLQGEANAVKIWCAELANHPNLVIEDNEKYLINVEIEWGICINGYDGEIGVDTGDIWYLWSKEYGDIHEVWMSTIKCVPYAREIPRFIISRNKPIFLTESIKDRTDAAMWGWLGKMDKDVPVSIANYKEFARGQGNVTNDDSLKHKYFTYNLFDFNKTNDTNINNSLSKTKKSTESKSTILDLLKLVEKVNTDDNKYDFKTLYNKTLWEALTWMYIVEYADFNPTKDFIEELTPEGFHQGGLGNYLRDEEISADALLEYGIKSVYKQTGPYNFDTNVWANATSYFKLNATGFFTNDSLIINKTLDDITNPVVSISPFWLAGIIKIRIQGLVDNTLRIKVDDKEIISITENGYYDVNFGIDANSLNEYTKFICLDKPIIDGNLIISLGDVKAVLVNNSQNKNKPTNNYISQYRGILDFSNQIKELFIGDYYINFYIDSQYEYLPIKLDKDGKPHHVTYSNPDAQIIRLSFNNNPRDIAIPTNPGYKEHIFFDSYGNEEYDYPYLLCNYQISTLNDASILPIFKSPNAIHTSIGWLWQDEHQYHGLSLGKTDKDRFFIGQGISDNHYNYYRTVTIYENADKIDN